MKLTWKKLLTCCSAAALLAFALPESADAQGFGGGFGGRGGGFGGRGGTTGSFGSSQRTYPGNGQIGEAVIMADPETRRIIVITDDQTAEHISQVVTNLDQPKPQVLIKVLFVEVRYTDDFDLGATISQANAELSNSSLRASLSSADALGAATGLFPTALDPATMNFLTGDLNATLRAIDSKAKAEVLSRPSIMTRNNQEAVITVGQEVPIVTNSRVDPLTSAAISTVQYEDVGIILRVTPFITQDGLVEMIVAPEISAVSSDTTVVPGSGALNRIDKRSAETVVVTQHGVTVVIGGLIETKKDEVVRKIPLLGDIPLLGNAFKRRTTKDVKTELVIFLTPYVIQRPSEVAAMTADETRRTSFKDKTFTKEQVDNLFEEIPIKPATEDDLKRRKKPRLPIVIPLD